MSYWQGWSSVFLEHGIVKGYEISGCNYLPVYMYFLKAFGWFNGSVDEIYRNINYVKVFTLVFDFAGIYLILSYLVKFNISPFKVFLILFNIAYLYNSILWGQVDSIFTFFAFASIFSAIEKKAGWSIIFLVLSLNTKLQAIIFFPVIAILLLPQFFEQPKSIFSGLIGGLILQTIIFWPFIAESKLSIIWNVVFGSVGFYPVVSMNAFNLWFLLLEGNLMELNDGTLFWGVTYKHWGLILFFLFGLISLLPLLLKTLNHILEKKTFSLEYYNIVLLTASIIPLIFFYFNTQMHERYSHPMILFVGFYALLSSDYIVYLLLSMGYYLNLEKILMYMRLKNYDTVFFDPKFISLIFLVGLFYLLFQLYSYIKVDELYKLRSFKLKWKIY